METSSLKKYPIKCCSAPIQPFFQMNEIKTGHIEFLPDPAYMRNYGYSEAVVNAHIYIMDWSTMTTTLTGTMRIGTKHSNQTCALMKVTNETLQLAMTGGSSKLGHYLVNLEPSGTIKSWSAASDRLPMEINNIPIQGLSYSQLLSIKNGSELLLYGGQIGEQIYDGIYKFMSASKTWLQIGKMKFPRAAHVVIPVQGLLCPL